MVAVFAGTYANAVTYSQCGQRTGKVTIPKDALPGQTIHIVLEASDDGSPSFTRYQRIIITVK